MQILIVTKNYRIDKADGVSKACEEIVKALVDQKTLVVAETTNTDTENIITPYTLNSIKHLLTTDLVIINGVYYKISIFYTILSFLLKKKYIIMNHGNITEKNLEFIKKKVFYLIYASYFIRKSFLFCYSSKQELVFNKPVKIKKIFFPFYVTKIKLEKTKKIIYFGRISWEKNLDVLVDAYEKIGKNEFLLEMYGTADNKDDLYFKKVSAYYKGYVSNEEKNKIISSAYCLVLPSKTESFPLTIGESLGLGTPVIVTNRCDWPVEEYGCGISIEPNERVLQKALTTIMSKSTEEIIEMGQKGQRLIKEQYSNEQFIQLIESIIKEAK